MTDAPRVAAVPVPIDLLEGVRYAELVVTIGVCPDDPEQSVTGVHVRPESRICLRYLAEYLREVADSLDAAHSDGPCGEAKS